MADRKFFGKEHQQMIDEARFMEISFYDVIATEKYKAWRESVNTPVQESEIVEQDTINISYPRPNNKLLKEILYCLGLDVSKGVEEMVCTHRTFSGEKVTTLRFNGFMRSDEKWNKFMKSCVNKYQL